MPQTPQFYSPYEPFAPPRGPHHTAHVPPTPYTDALDFRDSRFVNIPKDLRDQRLLADRDEHLIIAQANEEEKANYQSRDANFHEVLSRESLCMQHSKCVRLSSGKANKECG